MHSGLQSSKEWASGQDSEPSPVTELIKEQKTVAQERVGAENEVEAPKHSWNANKVRAMGERRLNGEVTWERIAKEWEG